MAASELQATGLSVEQLRVNTYPPSDREQPLPGSWISSHVDNIDLDRNGVVDDSHYEEEGVRIASWNDPSSMKGRRMLNNRAVLLADYHHMRNIAEGLEFDIDRVQEATEMKIEHYMAGLLAVNILVQGEEGAFDRYISPSSKLYFQLLDASKYQNEAATPGALWINEFTSPCKKPATKIWQAIRQYDPSSIANCDPKKFKERFKSVSEANRGWVAAVLCDGRVGVGDIIMAEKPLDPRK